jgi:hypothetical protein
LLQRLTALQFLCLTKPIAAALAALPGLQALVCCAANEAVALPAGAWLAPLRQLMLPTKVLAASLSVLGTAQQLELVASVPRSAQTQGQLAELIQWAGGRSHLRWLLLVSQAMGPGAHQQAQIDEAHERQPGLTIRVFNRPTGVTREAIMLVPDLAHLVL